MQGVLFVTHEYDKDSDIVWQFHCDNGDYRPEVLQLVRLDEILSIDSRLVLLASLPIGCSARRQSKDSAWIIETDPEIS